MASWINCSINGTTNNCSDTGTNSIIGSPGKSLTIKAIEIAAYASVSLVALLGNVCVALIICRNKMSRKTINLFILNMAISDLSVPCIFAPMKIYTIYSDAMIALIVWPFDGAFSGDFLCKLATFLADSSPVISILSLVLMAADRLYAVVLPLKAPRVRFRTRMLLVLGTWIVAFASFSPYFHAMSITRSGGHFICRLHWPDNHIQRMQVYSIFLCTVFTLIPFFVLAVMYSIMLYILRKQKVKGKHTRNQKRQKNNRNIVFMALTIVVVFAACWGPYQGFVFTATFVWKWQAPSSTLNIDVEAFFFTMFFLQTCNAALNPCIYFIFIQKYRNGLKRLLNFRATNFTTRNTLSETQNYILRRQLLQSSRRIPVSFQNDKQPVRENLRCKDIESLL